MLARSGYLLAPTHKMMQVGKIVGARPVLIDAAIELIPQKKVRPDIERITHPPPCKVQWDIDSYSRIKLVPLP